MPLRVYITLVLSATLWGSEGSAQRDRVIHKLEIGNFKNQFPESLNTTAKEETQYR